MGKERVLDEGAVTVVAVAEGGAFSRSIAHAPKPIGDLTQNRTQILVIGLNSETGEYVVAGPDETTIDRGEWKRVSIETAERELANPAAADFRGRQVQTARKQMISKPARGNVERDVIARGGDPNAKIPKRAGSFMLGLHPRDAGRKKAS